MIRILIVDDEEIIRKVMVKTFGKYGICKAVTNGNDALKLFKKAFESDEPYHLLVLDLSLEDISGLDILKEVRKMEQEKNLDPKKQAITIMVTGNNEIDIVRKCILSGCNDYILKPLKPDTVKQKLENLGINPLTDRESKKIEKADEME
ncbi:MAG: response regulator [Proteobacteria bacterium]|nr:response regulator [Pseudomonadota bacterium]